MMPYRDSSDASSIYRDRANADFASMTSTVQYGNLADVMKDAILIIEPTLLPMHGEQGVEVFREANCTDALKK